MHTRVSDAILTLSQSTGLFLMTISGAYLNGINGFGERPPGCLTGCSADPLHFFTGNLGRGWPWVECCELTETAFGKAWRYAKCFLEN